MKKNEIFPWEMEEGAAADFVDGTMILAVKDAEWNEDQLQAAASPFQVVVGESEDVVFFLLEGGPLDTCDFVFNIHDCDQKKQLLETKNLRVAAVLLDKDNRIQAIKQTDLNAAATKDIVNLLKKQKRHHFVSGEYDKTVDRLMETYEPAELVRFEALRFLLK